MDHKAIDEDKCYRKGVFRLLEQETGSFTGRRNAGNAWMDIAHKEGECR